MNEKHIPFLQRVELQNYKSIRECDVSLGPLMLLVGPNGSGKSNFLDSLRFVAESLRTTMGQALSERGGIKEVRRRSRGHPTYFKISLHVNLPEGKDAVYRFRVGAKQQVQDEYCCIKHHGAVEAEYKIRNGSIERASFQPKPPASTDRLYLTIASGFPEFRVLFDMLAGMGFYNINPDQLRDLQKPDVENLLSHDGRNAASVIAWLDNPVKERIEQYLGNIASGVKHVAKKSLGHKETLEFKQSVAGDRNLWSFSAQNMSDGTLRALGVLVSLFQCFDRSPEAPIPLVGIEEPESTLHPGAAGALFDALQEASHFTQVLVTTHSAELLSIKDIDTDSLLAVDIVDGETIIGPVDNASLTAIQDRMYTAGELLEMGQLKPKPKPSSEAKV